MTDPTSLQNTLANQTVDWVKASLASTQTSSDIGPTELALQRAELLWGKTNLTEKFRDLLATRGTSLYDRKMEHHFTGSAIVLNPANRHILMTFHPWYKIWQQLGGHDEGENDPVAVSAREAWEESGIEDLWVCDWPVRIDPHTAEKCKSVPGQHHNWHYDICYMAITKTSEFSMSNESVDMRWFTIEELKELVQQNKAQQRALEMAQNSLALYDALRQLGKLPD